MWLKCLFRMILDSVISPTFKRINGRNFAALFKTVRRVLQVVVVSRSLLAISWRKVSILFVYLFGDDTFLPCPTTETIMWNPFTISFSLGWALTLRNSSSTFVLLTSYFRYRIHRGLSDYTGILTSEYLLPCHHAIGWNLFDGRTRMCSAYTKPSSVQKWGGLSTCWNASRTWPRLLCHRSPQTWY